MNPIGTSILYIFIFALSTFFMYLAQRNVKSADGTKKRIFDIFWFLLAFVPLWIIMCFTNSGADYESYSDIIANARQIRQDNGIVEWVFYSLCIVLFDVFEVALHPLALPFFERGVVGREFFVAVDVNVVTLTVEPD